MKVCFFIPGFSGGGAEKQCLKIAAALDSNKLADVTIVYFFEGEYKEQLHQSTVKKIRIAGSFKSLKTLLALNQRMRQERFDLVVSWLPLCDIYAFVLKFIFINRFRWIVAERDSAYKNTLRNRLRMVLCRYATGIIANSIKGVDLWKGEGIPSSNLFFIPNIIDDPGIVPKITVADGEARILYIGRFEEKKNIPNLLAGLLEVANKYTGKIRIRLVGKGNEKEYILHTLYNSPARDLFEVFDFDPSPEKHYQWANVFVNVSFYEGMSNTLAESVMHGLAAVVTDSPENRYILGEAYPFYVTDIRSPQHIAAALLYAMSDFKEIQYEYAYGILRQFNEQNVAVHYSKTFNLLSGL